MREGIENIHGLVLGVVLEVRTVLNGEEEEKSM